MFTLCKFLTFGVGLDRLSAMKPENREVDQDLPVTISDTAWKRILPFLKAFPNVYVGNPEDSRRFLSAVVWLTKEGAGVGCHRSTGIGTQSIDVSDAAAMRAFLKNFMNISMLRVNFLRCLLTRRSCELTRVLRVPRKKNEAESCDQALGRCRGGFTTKLHAAVRLDFRPLCFTLTAGQRHDITQAPALIAGVSCQ